jgi:hypothetical protein
LQARFRNKTYLNYVSLYEEFFSETKSTNIDPVPLSLPKENKISFNPDIKNGYHLLIFDETDKIIRNENLKFDVHTSYISFEYNFRFWIKNLYNGCTNQHCPLIYCRRCELNTYQKQYTIFLVKFCFENNNIIFDQENFIKDYGPNFNLLFNKPIPKEIYDIGVPYFLGVTTKTISEYLRSIADEKLTILIQKNEIKTDQEDIEKDINPSHIKYFRGKPVKKMSSNTSLEDWKFSDKWQEEFIEPYITCQNMDWEIIEWAIVKKWSKVLQIIQYLGITQSDVWIFIKDPKSYEGVSHIIKKRQSTGWSCHGIVFLLTQEFPEIHSIVKEISDGMIFYKHEPIFLVNPHVIVFSNFLPIVYSEEISEIYTDIKILNDEDNLEDMVFKVENLI